MKIKFFTPLVLLLFASLSGFASSQPGYIKGEFICPADKMPTDMSHSATIVETANNDLIVGWFGGKGEHDSSCQIWASTNTGKAWNAPVIIADNKSTMSEVKPAWNPVLFKLKDGRLVLFYKLGDRPYYWWGLYRTSSDNGTSWSEAKDLPSGILGPIKNKPIQLENGDLLCPSSYETHSRMWNVYFNTLKNPDKIGTQASSWKITGPFNESATPDPYTHIAKWGIQAIQPTLLKYKNHTLQALSRTKQKRISEIWSYDDGKTWGKMQLTNLQNPDSGIDAVTLSDGQQLLVYNKSEGKNEDGESRTPLNVAISNDGKTWKDVIVLEDDPKGSYSYPAVIQTSDGLVHIVYSCEDTSSNGKKLIKHVLLDPSLFKQGKI